MMMNMINLCKPSETHDGNKNLADNSAALPLEMGHDVFLCYSEDLDLLAELTPQVDHVNLIFLKPWHQALENFLLWQTALFKTPHLNYIRSCLESGKENPLRSL